MAVRCIPKDDWFVEEYSDCQMCGCDKPYSEDWYCDQCNKSIEAERAGLKAEV